MSAIAYSEKETCCFERAEGNEKAEQGSPSNTEGGKLMNRADFLNKERWDAQRSNMIGSKLDQIIDLLEKLTKEEEEGE